MKIFQPLSISISILLLFFIALLIFSGSYFNIAHANELEFKCADDVTRDKPNLTPQEELLYAETISYLEGFIDLLSENNTACDASALARVSSYHTDHHGHKSCLSNFADVVAFKKQSKIIIANKEKFKQCFDSQKFYDVFKLYTPNQKMQQQSSVAAEINRPLLADYYSIDDVENIDKSSNIDPSETNKSDVKDPEIKKYGKYFSKYFHDIIANIANDDKLQNMSVLNLPHLWNAVGWIPFYATNDKIPNPRFRGGYAYSEVIGPWGMLRIKEINGKPYGLELGMTVQLADTYYPLHYHQPQEIYIPISEQKCFNPNQFLVMDWQHESFDITKEANYHNVLVEKNEEWQPMYMEAKPGDITYLPRNALHAFYLEDICKDGKPRGLVSIWARTTAHEHDQTTEICDLDRMITHNNNADIHKNESNDIAVSSLDHGNKDSKSDHQHVIPIATPSDVYRCKVKKVKTSAE